MNHSIKKTGNRLPRVLIVEDRPSKAELMARELKRAGLQFEWRRVDNPAEFVRVLEDGPDVILADHSLPALDAQQALAMVQARGLDIPFLIVSGTISEETAAEQIRRLPKAVVAALEQKSIREERREAAAKARQIESRNSAILNAALDAIIVADASGIVIDFNPAAETTFSISRAAALGRPMAEIIVDPPLMRGGGRGENGLNAGSAAEPPRERIETLGIRPDGTQFPVELVMVPVRSGAGVIFTAFVHDLTKRKERELIQQKTLELELENSRVKEASRLKSEFLANMSHELRTPLNAIIGFAELMHDGKVGAIATPHREYLGDILTSAKHLVQLINDILDLSKVESGKMDFRPARVDVEMMVSEVREIVRSLAAEKRIDIGIEIAAVIAYVHTDPRSLKQILYNYLSNALKFTPQDGRVVVRVKPEDADYFRIEVEDDGPGIKREDIGRLFTEFEQLQPSIAERTGGTGLGLALTRKIVEAQKGAVGVTSNWGQGSIFFAVLPRVLESTQRFNPEGMRAGKFGSGNHTPLPASGWFPP